MMYLPHWQVPETPLTLVVRANVAPASLAESLRRALSEAGEFRVRRVETMTEIVRLASASQRFSMGLVTVFAANAVVLAVVGLYGSLALFVGRRAKEIGVRFALGARPRDVAGMMVRRTLALVLTGVVLGLMASISASGVLRSVLFGVSPSDAVTYAAVAAGFVLLALVVGAIPMRRALRIDPVRLMRAE
jgi:ABC-type antimicrobial peptide transport system permease subunit